MSFFDRFRKQAPPPPPKPTLTAEALAELPHDGAARAVSEITGPLQLGQLVQLTVDDITSWGVIDVAEPVVGAFAAVIGYGAGGSQTYSFLNLELGGGHAHWLALEGEGRTRLTRAYLLRLYESAQLRDDLIWVLGQYLGCNYPTAPYLLEVGGPFDDGQQKEWTAYSARHGTIRTALGISKLFPNLGPNAEVEYQDLTLCLGDDPESAILHMRYIAAGDYNAVLVGERLPLTTFKVWPPTE